MQSWHLIAVSINFLLASHLLLDSIFSVILVTIVDRVLNIAGITAIVGFHVIVGFSVIVGFPAVLVALVLLATQLLLEFLLLMVSHLLLLFLLLLSFLCCKHPCWCLQSWWRVGHCCCYAYRFCVHGPSFINVISHFLCMI